MSRVWVTTRGTPERTTGRTSNEKGGSHAGMRTCRATSVILAIGTDRTFSMTDSIPTTSHKSRTMTYMTKVMSIVAAAMTDMTRTTRDMSQMMTIMGAPMTGMTKVMWNESAVMTDTDALMTIIGAVMSFIVAVVWVMEKLLSDVKREI
jgi:hypothetical protein